MLGFFLLEMTGKDDKNMAITRRAAKKKTL